MFKFLILRNIVKLKSEITVKDSGKNS